MWVQVGFEVEERYGEARLPIPVIAEPSLPGVCTVAKLVSQSDLPPQKDWIRGIAINIDNIENTSTRFLVSDVQVVLAYGNGHVRELNTGSRNLAFAPFDARKNVTSVTLRVDKPRRYTQTIIVPPTAQGVLNFEVNGERLNPPPFGELRLQVVGKSLVSRTYGPGTYQPVR
jgi:hypothetical protein